MEGQVERRKMIQRAVQLDHQIGSLVKSHANLVVAMIVIGIILRLHTPWLLAGLFITGLATYFAGTSLGLLCSLAISGLRFYSWAVHGFPDSSHIVLETLSYWCNVWLVYQYRQQKVRRQTSHDDQIMPWTVANEIRNSLAGIRFVLFPLYGQSTDTEIQRVTDEITKIEHLFEEVEQQNIRIRH